MKKKQKKLNVSFYLAHHDDETLFYMGLLFTQSDGEFKIIKI